MNKEEYAAKVAEIKADVIAKTIPPKSCATCENLADDGLCMAFNQYPPIEHIPVVAGCELWELSIPF